MPTANNKNNALGDGQTNDSGSIEELSKNNRTGKTIKTAQEPVKVCKATG